MIKNKEYSEKVLTQFILVHRAKVDLSSNNIKKIVRKKAKLVRRKYIDNNNKNTRCKKVSGKAYEIMNQSFTGEISNNEHKIIIDEINELKMTLSRNTKSIEILNKNIKKKNTTDISEQHLSRNKNHLSQKIEAINTKIDEIMNMIDVREQSWSKSLQTAEKKIDIFKSELVNKESYLQTINNQHQKLCVQLEEIEKKLKISERRFDESIQKNKELQDQIKNNETELEEKNFKISEAEKDYQRILLSTDNQNKKFADLQSETLRAEEKLASVYREIDLALKQLEKERTEQNSDPIAYIQLVKEKEIKMTDQKSPISKKVLLQIEENEKDQPPNMSILVKQMDEDRIKQSHTPLIQVFNQEDGVIDIEKSSEAENSLVGIIPDDREHVLKSEPWFDGICEDDLEISTDEEKSGKNLGLEIKTSSKDEYQKADHPPIEAVESNCKYSQPIIELVSKDRLIQVMRTEKKFLISLYKSMVLANKLSSLLFADLHNGTEGYMVRSLYFDSVDDRDYYEKEDGLLIRKKIRLRVYSPDDETVKLEKKEKHGDNQCKRTLNISRKMARQMILGNYDELFKNPHPFAQELYHDLVTGNYVPKCMVEYRRKAFIVPENDTRITIDSNIYASESSFDLFGATFNGYPVSHFDDVTLEVKYNNFLLSYVKDLLDSCQKTQVSFGKYYLGRSVGHGKYALFV